MSNSFYRSRLAQKKEVFTSAATIVQDVLQARVNESEPDNSRPDVEKLIRWANRAREKM